jgi:hypothetical protein
MATPTLFPPLGPSDFRADFWHALQPPGSADARAPHLVCRGAYAVPLLVPAACERWLAEIAQARMRLEEREPPNSMHEHGVDLVKLGFGPRIDALLERLRPLLARLYRPFDGGELDAHHSYLVEYGQELDDSLAWHADDSEVTLNLCLGEEFTGAELTFLGLRCRDHMQTRPTPDEVHSFEHHPGVLLLHAGLHRHRVEPIVAGTRRNVITWARSSRLRAKGTPPPAASFCPLHG